MEPEEQTAQIEEHHAPSFFQKNKFTILSIGILLLALIPLLILTQANKKQAPTQQVATSTPTATPTAALTQQNAQPTIDAATQQMQTALDQSQTELNAVGQINTSADATTGL